MFLASLLRRIAFSYYDYKAYNFNIEKTDFVVIHIPDQIGDAMAIFPVIRALELHKIKHLLIVTSTINLEVFNALKLEKTKLTLVTMTMQDHATLKEIKDLAKNITQQYGTPDLCIEGMRKKNLKTMLFISQLKAKTNFQVVGITMNCFSPLCKNASRMDQKLRAPVPMTWAFMMREAGFPAVRPIYELPLSEDVLDEVREEMRSLGSYIAFNLEGSSQERTFSLSIAENLIAKIQRVSGAGIFTAQYFGQKDHEGVRQTFRYKFWMAVILTIGTILLFLTVGENLISMYLQGEGTAQQIADTLKYGKQYLDIMLLGLPPFMMVQIYSSTLRECGETVLPMKAGVVAICVNLLFNYLLIYGVFFFPRLGVRGAAIATVLSRYVEAAIVIGWTHRHTEKNAFAKGLYSTLKVPANLTKKILVKGTPLLFNETLWASAMAMLTQCYSIRGLNVVASLNISNTINNVFNIVFIALGDSVAIIVGQLLGAGDMKKARDTDNKMIAFSVMCCTCVAMVMFVMAPLFPMLYNTNDEARELAKYLIMLTAFFMPQNAFLHATYFTLRSGGKTIITFLFDSVFIWCVSVPIAFVLSRYTGIHVLVIYACVQLADLIKCVIGFVLVKKGVWLQNIVSS